jgi:hypothetical protein
MLVRKSPPRYTCAYVGLRPSRPCEAELPTARSEQNHRCTHRKVPAMMIMVEWEMRKCPLPNGRGLGGNRKQKARTKISLAGGAKGNY